MTDWKLEGSERYTEKQRRMLNAICGCLEKQIDWFGYGMDLNDWRHWLCAVATKHTRIVPGYATGEGHRGFVVIGKSSLKTSKSEMTAAITIGLELGDNPEDQGLSCPPVKWSRAVLLGLGWNPNDLEE